MGRDLLLIAGMIILIGAVLFGSGALLLAPALPPDLVPPGATVLQLERRGPGRVAATVLLAEGQPANHVHQHISAAGWRLRRVNVLPDESDQTYFRRSLRGYVFESALVLRDEDDRLLVTLLYQRCVRRVSCGWR